MSKREDDIQTPENPENKRRRNDQLRKPKLRQPSLLENDKDTPAQPLRPKRIDADTHPTPSITNIRRINDHLFLQRRSPNKEIPEQKIDNAFSPDKEDAPAHSLDVKLDRSISVQEPVSYTHLDVYKRQASMLSAFLSACCYSVSYTHLDVYKRQLLI